MINDVMNKLRNKYGISSLSPEFLWIYRHFYSERIYRGHFVNQGSIQTKKYGSEQARHRFMFP